MSAIPNTIDKLVVMFGLIGPKVVDGPPVGVWQDEDCIIVGWQRDPGGSSEVNAGVRVEHTEGFVTTDEERFVVACMASVVGGDMKMQPLRERAVGLYEDITAAIRQDPTLLGSVAQAQVSTALMTQYLVTESGGVVDVSFDVSCIAFLQEARVRIDADVRELDVLAGMFAKAGGNVRKPVSGVLREAAIQVRADGRANVRKRSGRTQRSISFRSRQKGLEYQIGPTWFVGRFLEHGTKKMPAYPFMAPTMPRQADLPRRVVDAAVKDMTAATAPLRLI